MCEKDHARAKMEQEQSKHDCAREQRQKQRDTASGNREKSLTGTCTIFAYFLKLFRPPLCHLHHYISSSAPSTNTLHGISTCIFPDILLREAYCVHVNS